MNENDLKKHLDKLIEIEAMLSNDDIAPESNLINDIEKVLLSLSNDIPNNDIPNTVVKTEIPINIKKLTSYAIIPTYSKNGDAGMDLTITEIKSETDNDITYSFGIALEIPKDYVGLVFPRSSLKNYDLSLSNSVGVIDSGYRGEIMTVFKKTKIEGKYYKLGERCAQIIIIPIPSINFIEVNELNDTERGNKGYGSTGL
jgi:dUTP pyrophosphatase